MGKPIKHTIKFNKNMICCQAASIAKTAKRYSQPPFFVVSLPRVNSPYLWRIALKSQVLIFLLISTSLSAVIFLCCGLDKLFSKYSLRRIPEKFFLITSVFGGGIGLCLGMLAFHHKTNHWYFRLCAVLSGGSWMALLTFMLIKSAQLI